MGEYSDHGNAICVCMRRRRRGGGGRNCFCVCEGWHQASSSMTLHFIFASWGLKTDKWQVPLPAYLAGLSPPDFLNRLSSNGSLLFQLHGLASKLWDTAVFPFSHEMTGLWQGPTLCWELELRSLCLCSGCSICWVKMWYLYMLHMP